MLLRFSTWSTTRTLTGLSLAVLPLWILGIPGQQAYDSFYIGWKTGLIALVGYPAISILLIISSYIHMHKKESYKEKEILKIKYIKSAYYLFGLFVIIMSLAWLFILGYLNA